MNPQNLNKLLLLTCLAGAGYLGLTVSGAALAAKSDRDQQAEIDAGHWVDDPKKGFQLFSKGVDLTQGSLHIQADKATVYQDDDGATFSRIVLVGTPARWSEKLDDGAEMKAQANHIDYNVSDETVVLRGAVIINKDGDLISGETIRYNLATQLLSAGSDNNGSGRVKMTIGPKKKSGN
jgi:lipopolysaccharide export system protein LptA